MSFAQAGVQAGPAAAAAVDGILSRPVHVEAARIYARELAELGIAIDHKPQAFGQILGKVYGRKEVVTAMMGFGSPEERLDPDFYLRAISARAAASTPRTTAIRNSTGSPKRSRRRSIRRSGRS